MSRKPRILRYLKKASDVKDRDLNQQINKKFKRNIEKKITIIILKEIQEAIASTNQELDDI